MIGPESELLGDVSGKKILHLQCHFGQDSLSLARLGAKVTGVDLSDEAIRTARNLNQELGLDATFHCADVLDMDGVLDDQFDIVYTSYGVLYWLPDLKPWAATVDRSLKIGGRLLLVEFHPVFGMFSDDFSELQYSYFRGKGFLEDEIGSYAAPDATHYKAKSLSWDFSMSELFNVLINRGLSLSHFEEYNYSPYDLFSKSVKVDDGYQIKGLEGKLPLIFSLEMIKPEYYSDIKGT